MRCFITSVMKRQKHLSCSTLKYDCIYICSHTKRSFAMWARFKNFYHRNPLISAQYQSRLINMDQYSGTVTQDSLKSADREFYSSQCRHTWMLARGGVSKEKLHSQLVRQNLKGPLSCGMYQ